MAEAGERITTIVADANDSEAAKRVSAEGPREVVTDKGYHSRAVVNETGRVGRAHVLFGAESRTANLAGSAERTGSGLRQSPPHSRRAWPPIVTATRRETGAMESTLI